MLVPVLLQLVTSPASAAAPCADLAASVSAGWVALDDAEVARAASAVDSALSALSCQQRVVTTAELLDLYRLEGVVALASGDKSRAVVATLRAVAVDPTAVPPDDLGPDLQALHGTWAARLANATAELTLVGGGAVFVDGRQVDGSVVSLISGEHLLQVRGPDGWRGAIVECTGVTRWETGVVALAPTAPMVDLDATDPDPSPETEPRPPSTGARQRWGLVIAGGVVAAAGLGTAGYGYSREMAFLVDPFDSRTYGDCGVAQPCYASERAVAIQAAARGINVAYGVGYALTAVGVGLVGVELLILPSPAGATAALRLPLGPR